MHIRKARSSDTDRCLKLDHSVLTEYAWRMEEREHQGAITLIFQPVRLPRAVTVPYPRQGKELVAGWEECDLFLVAEDSGIIGYVTARSLPGHGLAWVYDLVVEPSRRRQGIGRALMAEVAAWARTKALEELVVAVPTRNYPAVCFCRALGLAFRGYHDHHWRTQDIALFFGIHLR
ncbi:MAG: GNAT family N-acetyltransferase [Anaerolineae bacterium]|nr:GNAT family N-acetyltransferase [Anaerolineae bacterium]